MTVSPTTQATLWMTGAIASFSVMAVSAREIGGVHDTFEIMLYRSLIGLVIVSLVVTRKRIWAEVSRRTLGTHLFRNLAHFTGQNLWLFAVTVAPLAQVFALEFTSPLWVIVLAPMLLGERLTRARVFAVALGFIGILIVARPQPDNLNIGIVAAASAAVFFALTTIVTKRLTRHESVASILFWLTLMQLCLGILAAGIDGHIELPAPQTAPWLILIGLGGLTAHFCITSALNIAPATVVVPLDFARLPVIAIVGMILYHEPFDFWVFIGGVLILVANIVNVKTSVRSMT